MGECTSVQRADNGLGQLITEYQSHSGAANINSTPKVQHAYTETSGGTNHRRPTSMTYPDGDATNDNYRSGLNDTISRLSSLSDTIKKSSGTNYLPTAGGSVNEEAECCTRNLKEGIVHEDS